MRTDERVKREGAKTTDTIQPRRGGKHHLLHSNNNNNDDDIQEIYAYRNNRGKARKPEDRVVAEVREHPGACVKSIELKTRLGRQSRVTTSDLQA